MTLVLSCIAPEYAVQVSDRCLTDLRTGIAVEQEANKAVVLSNRVAFAYTGLARIEGKPTDIWLRDALVPHQSIGGAVQVIVDEATRVFRGIAGPQCRKHQAFVGAGWARFPHLGDELRPFGVTISNAFDEEGHWLCEAAPEFVARGKVLKGPRWGFAWTHAGGLQGNRAVHLQRTIARMVKHGVGPAAMADIFINEVRRTAAVDKRVGRGVMVSSIPRAVLETDDLTAISSHPTRSELCFAHLRHDDVVGVAEGPHFVRPGGRVFSNFKTWRQGDAEYVQVDFRAA